MLKHQRPDGKVLEQLGYTSIEEPIYTFDHPEVQYWIEVFESRTHERGIFETFNSMHAKPCRVKASVIGTQWYRFSEFMPWFLCQAAAMMPNNELRHYVIQTAFEELGMRNSDEIHSKLFLQSLELCGISLPEYDRLKDCDGITQALKFLRTSLLHITHESEILGIMLGLEIPARENIETIFEGLAFTDELRMSLDDTIFFQLHREIEVEHVRLNVANFLRFCPSIESQNRFTRGFASGLDFWQKFWVAVSNEIMVVAGQNDV